MTEIESRDELYQQYCRTLKLLVQQMSHSQIHVVIGEVELHEALEIAKDIITQRLEDDKGLGYEEWKGDAKKRYAHLFRSIHGEVDLAVRLHFNVSDRNFVGRQFNGHVVEPLLEILKMQGPDITENISELIAAGHQAIDRRARDYTQEDAMIAKQVLVTTAKARTLADEVKKRKAYEKQIRLSTIRETAEALRM